MALHIFRVLVRGRFAPVEPDARARLLAELDAHAVAAAGFTETGTLTYDRALDSFGFRRQVRGRADDTDGASDTDVEARAVAEAERSAEVALAAFGAAARELRTSATDMASVWQRPGGTLRR